QHPCIGGMGCQIARSFDSLAVGMRAMHTPRLKMAAAEGNVIGQYVVHVACGTQSGLARFYDWSSPTRHSRRARCKEQTQLQPAPRRPRRAEGLRLYS